MIGQTANLALQMQEVQVLEIYLSQRIGPHHWPCFRMMPRQLWTRQMIGVHLRSCHSGRCTQWWTSAHQLSGPGCSGRDYSPPSGLIALRSTRPWRYGMWWWYDPAQVSFVTTHKQVRYTPPNACMQLFRLTHPCQRIESNSQLLHHCLPNSYEAPSIDRLDPSQSWPVVVRSAAGQLTEITWPFM